MGTLANVHVIPHFAAVDVTTTGTEVFGDPFDTGDCADFEIVLVLGAIATDTTVIKLYADANTVATGGTAINFYYKKSAAVGTDTTTAWASTGATTTTAGTGITLTNSTDDNKTVRIKPNNRGDLDGYPYLYLGIDPGESQTVGFYSAIVLSVPRYNQSVPPSAVD